MERDFLGAKVRHVIPDRYRVSPEVVEQTMNDLRIQGVMTTMGIQGATLNERAEDSLTPAEIEELDAICHDYAPRLAGMGLSDQAVKAALAVYRKEYQEEHVLARREAREREAARREQPKQAPHLSRRISLTWALGDLRDMYEDWQHEHGPASTDSLESMVIQAGVQLESACTGVLLEPASVGEEKLTRVRRALLRAAMLAVRAEMALREYSTEPHPWRRDDGR